MKDDNRLVDTLREQIKMLSDENAELTYKNAELLEQVENQKNQVEMFERVKAAFEEEIARAQAQKLEYEIALNEVKTVMAKYKSDMQKFIATITKK